MTDDPLVRLTVDEASEGMRFDVFLAKQLPQYSRVHLRRAINAADALIGGKRHKAAYALRVGEEIEVRISPPTSLDDGPEPEDIPLDILFEDEHLVAINKPSGMVVHPSKGHWKGTLTAGLAFHFQSLSSVGGPTRPGIVHRLDRDTTGVILVAKTDAAHMGLAKQFELRSVKKEYWAITIGCPDRDRDVIEQPIGTHPYQREKMAIRADHSTSRDAKTFYEVCERFGRFAFMKAFPKTGRTHQIRIHFAHVGAPILCDPLYSGRSKITLRELQGEAVRSEDDAIISRSALHARRIEFQHPITSQAMTCEAPLAEDFAAVLTFLRNERKTKR